MKKRLVALVVVAILLATVLSGCTLFVKNEERDYKQVLATIENRGVTATITKGEFYEYYSQNAPTYIQYYNWTAARCVNEFLNALAKKEIILIEAKAYFAEKNNIAITSKTMDFLTENERKWVIRRTNKSFQDALDTEIKEIVATDKANAGTEDEEVEDDDIVMPTPRTEFPTEDKEAEYKEKTAYEAQEKFFEALDKDTTLTETQKKAVKTLKKNLSDQYKDYSYYEESQAESRLLAKYQDIVKKGGMEGYSYNISDEDVLYKYKLTLNSQSTANLVDSNYTTALDGDSIILFHNNQYVKVKSILLKFTDKQTALLTAVKDFYKTNGDSTDLVNTFRDMLVFGAEDGTAFPFPIEEKHLQLLVNISNIKYKADSDCTDKECDCKACENNPNYDKENKKCTIKLEDENGNFILNVDGCKCAACENNAFEKYNVPFKDVLKSISEAVVKAGVDADAEYATKFPEGNATGKAMYVVQAKLDEFEKWMYKVNDDAGIFEKGEYLATPEGKTSEYVTEYTALIRAMLKDDKATAGQMSTEETTYTVDGKVVNIHTMATENGKISYIINDFGVHIVMMSTVPVDLTINGDKITSTESANGKDTYYTLGIDAIIGFDEETGLPITVKDKIKKQMEEQAKTDLYSRFERNVLKDYGKIMFAPANKNTFKLDKKVLNEIADLLGIEKGDLDIK